MIQRLPLLVGLVALVGIPASAKTDCAEVKTAKGQVAYETCRAQEQETEILDAIKKHKDAIDDQKKDISDYYEDIVDNTRDRRDDEDRVFERIERDERRRLEDLQDDEASKDTISAQRERLKKIQRERKALKKFYDEWINYIETQEDLEKARLDFDQARYELERRGGSLGRVRRY